jgi:hypothetical protein
MKKYFIFVVLSIFTLYSFAATKTKIAENCTYSVINGWTQTINYQCSADVNLNNARIEFTVDNPTGIINLNSVWGFVNLPSYPIDPKLVLNGNKVTLALKFASDTVLLQAGKTTNFSYSTNNNVNVTSFALYTGGEPPPSSASLKFNLVDTKPSDVNNSSILVHAIDNNKVDHPVNIPWGGQATINGLVVGMKYIFSADEINGQQNQYQFKFTPPDITLVNGQNNVTISSQSKPISTGTAKVTINGLPNTQNTDLYFKYSDLAGLHTIIFNNISNGVKNYLLPANYSYELSAKTITDNGFSYSVAPVNINIQKDTMTPITLTFNKNAIHGVNGWPNYLAMGAVTDNTNNSAISFQTRPIDAIFKYGGFGGNGDRGQIFYPIFEIGTGNQAKSLSTYYEQKGIRNRVKPVMVIYTAEMSGGTSFEDFEYSNLVMHYINLLMESQKLQSYKTSQNAYPASIILNPDLLGMIQQQNLLSQLNVEIGKISLKKALQTAICFITHTINTPYGQNLNYEALFQAIRSQTTDDWSAMSTWDQYKMRYFNDCTANPTIPDNINIPAFTNDFPGWAQSTNWLLRKFADGITFGWQVNLWGIGSSNWVHKNYSNETLKSQIADPTAALIISSGTYDPHYLPDFIVFDKYEMDALPGAVGSGYLYNARDLSNLLLYVKNISESLGSIPVMLWQIPGGHLQIKNDVDTRNEHGSTEPDFFFGDMQNPIPNLKPYITNISLPASIYGITNISNYLSMNETGGNTYTWQAPHLIQAVNSHVFSILWGGGNTTSVGVFPSNDNGWLANQIIRYYQNPIPLFKK